MRKFLGVFLTFAMLLGMVSAAGTGISFPASAEDTNLLAGMSYTAEYNAFQGGYEDSGNQLTDGKYRGDGETDWNDNGAVSGISVEYAGSNAQTIITFEFDAAVDLNSIIVRGVRAFFLDNSVNRHGRLANVGIRLEGEEDYGPAAFEASYEAIEGAPESKTSDESATGPQFYNINATLVGVEGITGLKLVFDTYKGDDIGTNAYIFQVDEIEAYGSASPEAPSEAPVVSEEPTESSEEPVVSEEPTESSEEPAVSEEPTESSEEPTDDRGTNVLAGMSYTAEYNAFQDPCSDSGNQLTDGHYRGDGDHDWNDNAGLPGVSVEYAGSNAQTIITFEFDEAVDLETVIVRGVRAFFLDNSVNRHGRLANVGVRFEGEEDYGPAAFTAEYEDIEGAPESKTADESATGPQFYNINATLTGVEGITGLKLAFDTYKGDDIGTNAYIFQVDEIEAYAPVSQEESSEAPAESSEEPVVSEEPIESSEESVESSDETSDADITADETSDADVTTDETSDADITADETSDADITADETSDETSDVPEEPKGNLAAGKSYTYTTYNHVGTDADGNTCYDPSVNDEITITPVDPDDWLSKGFDDQYFHAKACSDNNGTGNVLTDGVIRNASELNPGDSIDIKRVELIGTFRTHEIDIDLDGAYTVDTVFLPNLRRGGNRYANIVKIEVKVDGVYEAVTFTENAVVAATVMNTEDPDYYKCRGTEDLDPDHQYYDVTLTFPSVDNVTNVRITFDTNFAGSKSTAIQPTDSSRSYVLALEEIEIYGPSAEEPEESSDETSEETSDDVTVADITYKVVAVDNGDGTVTVTASLPADVLSGKIVITASDKLSYVEGSLDGIIKNVSNPAYDRDGLFGQCVAFANPVAYEEGTVVFTAVYRLAEGAALEDGDILVPYWDLSDGIVFVGTSEMGEADIVVVPYEAPIESSSSPLNSLPSSPLNSLPNSRPNSLLRNPPKSLPRNLPTSLPTSLLKSPLNSLPRNPPKSPPSSLPRNPPKSPPSSLPRNLLNSLPTSLRPRSRLRNTSTALTAGRATTQSIGTSAPSAAKRPTKPTTSTITTLTPTATSADMCAKYRCSATQTATALSTTSTPHSSCSTTQTLRLLKAQRLP